VLLHTTIVVNFIFILMMMIIGIDLGESSIRFISGCHYNNFEHHPPNNSTQKNDMVGRYYNNYYLSIVCGKGNKRMTMETKKT
jgi:hypothetical protein